MGDFSTLIGGTQYNRQGYGLTYHVPFSVGIALGEAYAYELALSLLYHPVTWQRNGGITLGFEFPL